MWEQNIFQKQKIRLEFMHDLQKNSDIELQQICSIANMVDLLLRHYRL